jgi:WD40 repeat protein
MANQSQTGSTLNPKESTMRVIAARIKVLRLLSVAVVALLFLAATAHADIFVANFGDGTIKRFDDAGNLIPGTYITGLGSSEGVACIKLSSNELYVANNSGTIHVFDLATGAPITSFAVAGAQSIAAMSFSIDGSVLYAADYGAGMIFGVNPNSPHNVIYHAPTTASHDVRVGPDGYVYATHFLNQTGVVRFSKDLTTSTQFVAYNDHGLARAGGLAFDGSGNLWVTDFTNPGAFISEYQNSGGISTYLRTVADSTGSPLARISHQR